MNLLYAGNKRRTTESTNINLTSSRSHAVFQITVKFSLRLLENKKLEILKKNKLYLNCH